MHGRHLAALVVALGLAFTLAACGGGGGGAPVKTANPTPAPEAEPTPVPETPAPEAEPTPALETPAPQVSESGRIKADLNRRIAESDRFIEGSGQVLFLFRPANTTLPEGTTLADFGGGDGDADEYEYEDLGSRRGASLAKGERYSTDIFSFLAYSALLQHSMFLVTASVISDTARLNPTDDAVFPNVYSIGATTGSTPTVAATWSGVMAGVDMKTGKGVAAENRLVQGDAAVTLSDIANPSLNVAFTNITNAHTGASHPNITWTGLAISNGAFSGSGIMGQFYSPDTEEVGGVFYRTTSTAPSGRSGKQRPVAVLPADTGVP